MESDLHKRLSAPFPLKSLGFKPQVLTKDGKKALPVAYIDARDVAQRLDEVVGCEKWRDEYIQLQQGMVECHLSLYCYCGPESHWVAKIDVGAPSEQPDGADRVKAAYSDAFKRAAVKWGIGRYLYALELPWTDIDEYKKFKAVPLVPAWALPAPEKMSRFQAERLSELIEASDTKVKDVLAYYKVAILDEIPRDQFEIIEARLQSKIDTKKGTKP